MAQVKVKAHPLTDTSIVPEVFYSSFVVEPQMFTQRHGVYGEFMVNIEDYMQPVDDIDDEELENLDDVSAMDIDVYE